jgi:hypothetical protein
MYWLYFVLTNSAARRIQLEIKCLNKHTKLRLYNYFSSPELKYYSHLTQLILEESSHEAHCDGQNQIYVKSKAVLATGRRGR